MTTKEIANSRLALKNAGTLSDQHQLRSRFISKLRHEVGILQQRKNTIQAGFRRRLERWRTEEIPQDQPVCAIASDVQDSRLYRITAVFAFLCEMGLAAWIFWHLGVGWLFGVLTALFITATLHGVFLQIFNDPERPKETVHRLKTRAALPAIIGFLAALGIGILARYVSGGMALLLLPLFSFSLWLGTVSLLILAASLFTLAHVLGWSARHDKAYRKLDDEERASAAFLGELQPEAARITAPPQVEAAEVLPALREHSPDGRRTTVLPLILLLVAAFSFTNGCATALSPNATSTPPKTAEASITDASIPKGGANLHILIDWSGS
ncbi:MAG: hypothetical protein L0387_14145 [Acidobacteria bacterium]|nr:hypothetical protein [Acidobacteriota bacterium]